MKKIIILLLPLSFLMNFSCKTNKKKTNSENRIKITWVENLKGDFSFKEQWNYRDGIYKNKNEELRLDTGMVTPELETTINRMKDETGEIYEDSLTKYYSVIDTTHIFHSIKSKANIYEGTVYDHMEFKKLDNDEIKGVTINDVSGYSHLHIKLKDNYCYAWNDYNSISSDIGNHIFGLKNGEIFIDKSLFQKGIIKAEFDFNFKNTLEKKDSLYWKGRIYSKLKD